MTEIGTDWRMVDGVATAWFDAPSLVEGAALAGRFVELSAEIAIDLRATGVRVRLDSDDDAEAVSAAARDLGLTAKPAALQQLSVVFDPPNPTVVSQFWQRVLDYAPADGGGLVDPLRREMISGSFTGTSTRATCCGSMTGSAGSSTGNGPASGRVRSIPPTVDSTCSNTTRRWPTTSSQSGSNGPG